MRYLKAVVAGVVGLFVTDWIQTAGILLILGAGYATAWMLELPGAVTGYGLAGLLAMHLVFTTVTETRRRRRHR